MKILLIDNNTVHKTALAHALAGHDVEVQKYEPGLDFHDRNKDIVILSGGGGEGQEIADVQLGNRLWYEDEMKFVLACQKPVVGICMGFEVIANAFGAKVAEMDTTYQGFKAINLHQSGSSLSANQLISQFNAHKWHVPEVSQKHFDVLAESETGIEIIKHKTRPIIATQFHPEKGGTLSLSNLFSSLTI